jgi:uncharacterized protein (TIGR03067 family)
MAIFEKKRCWSVRKLSFTFAACILTLQCCRAHAGDADDTKKIQGTWEIVELIQYGRKVDFQIIKGTKFVFSGDRLSIVPASDKVEEFEKRSFFFKLDPTKKPAEVELKALDGNFKGIASTGIYELKGDTLRWCQSDAAKAPERPKEFNSPPKSTIYLFTLKLLK